MICRLLGDLLALNKFVGHQLTVFLLEGSEHVRHGVVDGVCHTIENICEIRFLDRGNNLLHESLLDSCHLSK